MNAVNAVVVNSFNFLVTALAVVVLGGRLAGWLAVSTDGILKFGGDAQAKPRRSL